MIAPHHHLSWPWVTFYAVLATIIFGPSCVNSLRHQWQDRERPDPSRYLMTPEHPARRHQAPVEPAAASVLTAEEVFARFADIVLYDAMTDKGDHQ